MGPASPAQAGSGHSGSSRRSPHFRRTAAGILAIVALVATVAVAEAVKPPKPPPGLSAAASVAPTVQFLGDSVGTTFAFTVRNTGTVSIGAVEIARPSTSWTVVACPSAPTGWSTQRSDNFCRYRSAPGTADDLAPGATSNAFGLRASTLPGSQDRSGTWRIRVSKSDSFDDPSTVGPAIAMAPGLTTTAHSWEILDAVVGSGVIGSACPAPSAANHSAVTGTSQTILVCGRNRTTVAATPSAALSSLGGQFVASPGTFASASIPAGSGNVVLATWTGATITGSAGAGLSVEARIGSPFSRTSPLTRLDDDCSSATAWCLANGGYEALNEPPEAQPASASTFEDQASAPITLTATDADDDDLVFSIVTGPAHGSLDPISAPDCLPVNTCTASVVYTPAPDYFGPDSFTFTATDPFSATSAPALVSIAVDPVNDAPTATNLSAAESYTEDTTRDLVDIVVADIDSANVTATLTLSNPALGSLTTATSGSVTSTYVAGTGVWTALGPLANVNVLLAGVSFVPAADVNASFTIATSVSDGVAAPITGSKAVTGIPVNDEPSFDLPASPDQTVDSTDGPQTVAGFATNISVGPANESGQGLTFHVSNNGNPLFASQPDIDEASGDLTYSPASGAGGTAMVSVYLTDDGGTADGGDDTGPTRTFTITVVPPNATPVALSQTGGGGVTTSEGASITITLTATDADDDDLTFAIVPGQGPTHGSLGTISASDCTTTANTCTATVEYTPTGDYDGPDAFTFVANDGTIDSNPATVEVTVTPVNDAPVVVTSGGSLGLTEGDGATAIDPGATVSDVDDTNLESGSVQLTTGCVPSEDVLALTSPPSGITAGYTAATCTLTLSGTATVADYQAALRAVTYANVSDAPGTAARVATFTVNDGDANGSATRSITVTAVNDTPVNTVPGSQTMDEDQAKVFSSGNGNLISIADPDAGGGSVEVTLDADHGTLTLAGVAGLTFSVGDGTSDATMTFSGTVATVNAALAGMSYQPGADWNSTRGSEVLTIATDDQGNTGTGGALSDTDTVAITVNAVNDAPVAAPKAFSAQANMRINGLTGLLTGATDPDTGDDGYVATFTVGTVGPATTPAGGTISNLDTSTGTFDFDPPPGATGSVTFTYTVCDSGSPGPSVCSAPATVTVTVAGPVIWFVDPAAGVNGDGRLSSPFNTLASAAAADATGHRIFLYSGTATSGITLNTSEWLVGQGVTGTSFDTVFGITPPAGTIARPSVNGARPTVQGNVVMAGSAAVRGLNITPSSGTQGLTANAATGLTVGEVSVTTTNAIAVNLTGGTSGTFSFTAINANGGTSGIVLSNVNTGSGSFTVTGTGSAGSGGTIQNTTDNGLVLATTANVSLSRMSIANNGNALTEGGIRATGLTGTNAITSSTISGGYEDNVFVQNTSGTMAGLTIGGAGCSITNNGSSAGNTGITVLSAGTANMTVTVDGCSFSGNRTDTIHVDAGDTATLNATIANNTITGGSPNQGNIGIEVTAAVSAQVTFDVNSNVVGSLAQPLLNTGINVFNGGTTSSMSGRVRNNVVVNAGTGSGSGIRVFNSGNSSLYANVTNNTVSNVALDYGILVESSGGTTAGQGVMQVAVTNNNASVLSNALDSIRVQARATNTVCGRISGNTTNAGGTIGGFFGLYLRQANTAVFNLEGLASGPQTAATTQTYAASQNPLAASVGAAALTGFTGVAPNSCNLIP